MHTAPLGYRVSPALSIAVLVPVWLFVASGLGRPLPPVLEPVRSLATWLAVVRDGEPSVPACLFWLAVTLAPAALALRAPAAHRAAVWGVYAASLPVVALTVVTVALVADLPASFLHTASAPGPVAARIAGLLGIGGSVIGGLVLAWGQRAAAAAGDGDPVPAVPLRFRVVYGVTLVGTLLGASLMWGMG